MAFAQVSLTFCKVVVSILYQSDTIILLDFIDFAATSTMLSPLFLTLCILFVDEDLRLSDSDSD